MGSVIVITSGKGGTGKTTLTGGIGAGLATLGRSVLCIDADIGLRNLDIALGMTDTVLMDFTDVMEGRCSLDRAAAPHPAIPNLSLLTAPLTIREPLREDGFRALLAEARKHYDDILVDSPAGFGAGFRLAVCGADRAIVVATGDSASLRDAQRTVGQLSSYISDIRLVVNRVQPKLLRRLGETIDDVMDATGLPLLGIVPEDPQVVLAAHSGRALMQTERKGAAVACLNIAKRMAGRQIPLMKIR